MKDKEIPNYYGILPAAVRYDSRLKPMTKIMYSEITALSNKWGYCTANNRYFADLYKVHASTVSRWMAQLNEFNYVRIEIDATKGNERKVYPNDQNVNTYTQKSQDPYTQKSQDPIDEKVKNNNTSINTTRLNTKSNKEAAKAAPEKIITSKIQNEKRKKVAPKKEKAAGLPFLMWEVWAERHERLHREKPTQDAKFFKHLKDLAGKRAARIEAQGAEVSDAAICNNFGLFLDMLIQKGDGWYHTNFTPDIFNGKFLNIIQLLKQQHNEEQQLADKYARVIASFAN